MIHVQAEPTDKPHSWSPAVLTPGPSDQLLMTVVLYECLRPSRVRRSDIRQPRAAGRNRLSCRGQRRNFAFAETERREVRRCS